MDPYWQGENVTLYHGDCIPTMAALPADSVDAIVCDPPYGLEFMGKDWDAPWKASSVGRGARVATERATEMTAAGKGHTTSGGPYLAARVDSVRVAGAPFQAWCLQWATEALRVLKPGGHLLAFGGTRTWHRLAVAVEDAGFEIRDSIAWLYGSGFPKSLDVSKAIDKRPGVKHHAEFVAHLVARREAVGLSRADVSERVVGTRSGACWNWEHHQFPEARHWPALRDLLGMDETKWGPIIAEAERAKLGTRAGSALEFAPGEVCERRAVDIDITAPATPAGEQWQGWGTALKPAFEPIVFARKPLVGTVAANVLAHGTGALNIDGCRIASGDDTSRTPAVVAEDSAAGFGRGAAMGGNGSPLGRWPANVVLDADQAATLNQQSGTLTSGLLAEHHARSPKDAGILGAYGSADGERGYGDTGGASRFFYVAKAPTVERPKQGGIAHPTVKPIDLMQWLVRLVTPPGGTVLDPFAGSGTTGEATIREGFTSILIEREADYLPLIRERFQRPINYLLDFDQ